MRRRNLLKKKSNLNHLPSLSISLEVGKRTIAKIGDRNEQKSKKKEDKKIQGKTLISFDFLSFSNIV